MPLAQLIYLIPAPDNPMETGTQKKWAKVQERLGLVLPADYKAFIDSYGTGNFSNGISPYSPFASDESRNLFQALDLHHQASRQVQKKAKEDWSIVHPYKLYPAPGGLLPWGTMLSFEIGFFWLIDGKPASWKTILYNLRRGEYEVWKFCFTHFLYQLISGEIKTLLLPAEISLERSEIRFCPYQEES